MATEIEKNMELLNQEEIGPVFFVTPNPNRGIGLEMEIKNYHIICSQNSDIVDYLKRENISVLCLDEEIKNSGKLLENKKVLNFINKQSKGKKANIISFKPSPKIQKICNDHNFRYLGNDWKLNRKFEDKIEFVNVTDELKIPNAESKIIKLENSKRFKNNFNLKNNNKCVIQLPRGYSGNSTFLINDQNDLSNIIKKYEKRTVKVSKYIEGDTYTINACACKSGVVVSQPIFQITGLTDYNKHKLGTSGNDYINGEKLNVTVKKNIFDYTKKIGEYMAQSGYRGIFGLDFIVAKNEVYLIEINPRLVGSIPVFTKLQIQKCEIPFMSLHLLEFLKNNFSLKLIEYNTTYSLWSKKKNYKFSQLILRNTQEEYVEIKKTLISGVYKINKNKLIFKSKNYFAKNLQKGEILIQTIRNGDKISPDLEYANIQFEHGIIKDNSIKSDDEEIINKVLDNIEIK